MNHAPLISPAVSLRHYGALEASDVHPFHQIVLGVDGAMDMAVDGIERRIDCQGAWIVPAGARHEYSAEGVNRQLVVDLPMATVAVPERFFERARPIDIDVSIVQMVRRMAAGANGGSQRFAWEAATHVCAALIADAAPLDARALDFARIDRWMRARLSEPLRVADLAAHCGFGMRRFHQVFCEAFGETPRRYLQRLRLDTALALLADPRETLTDVALQTGFADQSAFTHAFTRRFGMAPGQWRTGRH
jgi:transcriptional regulator GlxA family with amidase domain